MAIDDLVAAALDRPADDLLAVEGSVDLGGVDVGDAEVQRPVDGADRLVVVEAAAGGVGAGHGHGAEADAGDLEAAEVCVLHVLVLRGVHAWSKARLLDSSRCAPSCASRVLALVFHQTSTDPAEGVPVEGVTARDPHGDVAASTLGDMAATDPTPDIRDKARAEIREFLSTRRARVTPEAAGLPSYGGDRRRVAGLRREEVALLAGVSPQYYIRLERGDATGVSESVVDGIARALQLDDVEHAHLLDLIRTASSPQRTRRRRPPAAQRVRPTVQRIVDAMPLMPAMVLNGRLDILTTNTLGRALFAPAFEDPFGTPNTARFVFLDPAGPGLLS